MSGRILFISDLHLQESRPDLTRAFCDFLEDNSESSNALYILGDLFEVWIGDDASSSLNECVASAILNYSQNGNDVFIMHGNRDFLIGEDFTQRCGAKLISEPYRIKLSDSQSITLLHGDILCSDDTDYQQFRQLVRNPQWQKEFLGKSIAEREAFAAQARSQSKQATAEKKLDIMDVNEEAVAQYVSSEKVDTLIHGHTHRPAVHDLPNSQSGKRIVLGDWDTKGWFIELINDSLELREFDLQD